MTEPKKQICPLCDERTNRDELAITNLLLENELTLAKSKLIDKNIQLDNYHKIFVEEKAKYEELKEKVCEALDAIESFLGSEPYLVYIDSVEETICMKMKELRELVK